MILQAVLAEGKHEALRKCATDTVLARLLTKTLKNIVIRPEFLWVQVKVPKISFAEMLVTCYFYQLSFENTWNS